MICASFSQTPHSFGSLCSRSLEDQCVLSTVRKNKSLPLGGFYSCVCDIYIFDLLVLFASLRKREGRKDKKDRRKRDQVHGMHWSKK